MENVPGRGKSWSRETCGEAHGVLQVRDDVAMDVAGQGGTQWWLWVWVVGSLWLRGRGWRDDHLWWEKEAGLCFWLWIQGAWEAVEQRWPLSRGICGPWVHGKSGLQRVKTVHQRLSTVWRTKRRQQRSRNFQEYHRIPESKGEVFQKGERAVGIAEWCESQREQRGECHLIELRVIYWWPWQSNFSCPSGREDRSEGSEG